MRPLVSGRGQLLGDQLEHMAEGAVSQIMALRGAV